MDKISTSQPATPVASTKNLSVAGIPIGSTIMAEPEIKLRLGKGDWASLLEKSPSSFRFLPEFRPYTFRQRFVADRLES